MMIRFTQQPLDNFPYRHILILADIEGSSGCGCYLPPVVEETLFLSRPLYNLVGRLGRLWVRRQVKALFRH